MNNLDIDARLKILDLRLMMAVEILIAIAIKSGCGDDVKKIIKQELSRDVMSILLSETQKNENRQD